LNVLRERHLPEILGLGIEIRSVASEQDLSFKIVYKQKNDPCSVATKFVQNNDADLFEHSANIISNRIFTTEHVLGILTVFVI
jgi:hypothetical protein